MDASLVREGAVAARYAKNESRGELLSSGVYKRTGVDLTHVTGLWNGMDTWTASATRFSISRSIGRLYLDLT